MDEEKGNGDSSTGASDASTRPMFQGEWECAGCKKVITELPFQPNEGQEVHCKECYLEKRGSRRPNRPMVQGDWQCSECDQKITELPFQPSGDRPIFCRECYKKSKI